MNEELFKETVSRNLIYYRKSNNLTQLDLANKLNYSDKAISKWERGESIPDAYTLSTIAELYGVTMNDLCGFSDEPQKPREIKKHRNKFHAIIVALSIGLVWFIATFAFAVTMMINENYTYAWLSFIYAIPVSCIVLVVLSAIWFNNLTTMFSISGLVWSLALSFHITFSTLCPIKGSYLAYIIAIPFQVLVVAWYIMLRIKAKNKVTQ